MAVLAGRKYGVIGRSRKGASISCFTCNGNKGLKGCLHLKVFSAYEVNIDEEEDIEELMTVFNDIYMDGNPKGKKKETMALVSRYVDQYGACEEELLPWRIWNNAVNTYHSKVLKTDEKKPQLVQTVESDQAPSPKPH